jgi:hypothetical protein
LGFSALAMFIFNGVPAYLIDCSLACYCVVVFGGFLIIFMASLKYFGAHETTLNSMGLHWTTPTSKT